MLNFAAPLGEKNTNWEEAILNLKIKIIDDFEIIKNKWYFVKLVGREKYEEICW